MRANRRVSALNRVRTKIVSNSSRVFSIGALNDDFGFVRMRMKPNSNIGQMAILLSFNHSKARLMAGMLIPNGRKQHVDIQQIGHGNSARASLRAASLMGWPACPLYNRPPF